MSVEQHSTDSNDSEIVATVDKETSHIINSALNWNDLNDHSAKYKTEYNTNECITVLASLDNQIEHLEQLTDKATLYDPNNNNQWLQWYKQARKEVEDN